MRAFILFLSLGLCFTAAAQTSGMLVAGINGFPGENPLFGGKLAYFRQFKPRQFYGVKLALATDALGAGQYDHRFFATSLDLVRRWPVGNHLKKRLWFDTGITVMQDIEMDPPNSRFYCGTGLTDEDFKRIDEEFSKWYIEKKYYAGLALGTVLEFRLARWFYLGLDLSTNVYYSFTWKSVYVCPNPAISWSFPVTKFKKEAHHGR